MIASGTLGSISTRFPQQVIANGGFPFDNSNMYLLGKMADFSRSVFQGIQNTALLTFGFVSIFFAVAPFISAPGNESDSGIAYADAPACTGDDGGACTGDCGCSCDGGSAGDGAGCGGCGGCSSSG
ncbi:MAG: hypothetical protein WA021_03880 [Minisyncoccia bacterium]